MNRISIAIAALALTACAGTPAPSGRECFKAERASGFTLVDDHTLHIRVGASRNYALTTRSSLRDLDFERAIALRARPAGWVCVGTNPGAEIIGGEPFERTWIVETVTRIERED